MRKTSTGGFATESKETADGATGGFETKSKGTDEKGAIGGHAAKTETTSNQAQGDTGASISELIIAMTEAFKRSSVKSSSSDPISRNIALKGNCHELTCAIVLTVSGAGRHYLHLLHYVLRKQISQETYVSLFRKLYQVSVNAKVLAVRSESKTVLVDAHARGKNLLCGNDCKCGTESKS